MKERDADSGAYYKADYRVERAAVAQAQRLGVILLKVELEKKNYLMRYRKNREAVRRLEKKAVELDQQCCRTKSQNFTGMPRGGTPVSIEEMIADKEEIEERIQRLKSKGRTIRAELLSAIDDLENARHAEILEAFFVDCKEFDEIAREKEYNKRHVIRLYTEAVNSIALP